MDPEVSACRLANGYTGVISHLLHMHVQACRWLAIAASIVTLALRYHAHVIMITIPLFRYHS